MMSLIDICEGSRFIEGDVCGDAVLNILHGGEGRCDCCRWTRIGAYILSSVMQYMYSVSDINLSIFYWEVFDVMIPLMMQWLPALEVLQCLYLEISVFISYTVCVPYW